MSGSPVLTGRMTMPAVMTAERVLAVLTQHIGASHGVSIHRLADQCVFPQAIAPDDRGGIERQVRKLIEELRLQGQHICAHPASGYYIAANVDELNDTCEFLRSRAMKSLRQVSAMQRVSLPDLVGQRHLDT